MNDTLQRITDLVKGEIRKLALGEPIGVSVTQTFAPVQTPQGVNMFFSWVIAVDTRNPLLGQDQICFPVIIPCQPGYMPNDKAFKDSAKMAVEGLRKLHAEALGSPNSTPDDGTIDGTGLVMGK